MPPLGFSTYDPLDSFRQANPYLRLLSQRPQSPFPVMTPEEESSLLGSLTDRALGGLQWVGETLDKPGAAVRGLLAGKPEQLLNLIPFSDTLGITDPSQRVSGTQLLQKAGLLGSDPGIMGTIAGIGTEIALDPTTYLSFGSSAVAKGSLGAAAKAAGVLPKTMAGRIAGLAADAPEALKLAQATGKTLAEVAGKPLGGLVGLGLPFMEPDAVLGTGAGALRAAEWLGKGSDFLKALPPVPHLRSLFQGSVMGQTHPLAQEVAEGVTARTPEVLAQARAKVRPLMERAKELGLDTPQGGRLLSDVIELWNTPHMLPGGNLPGGQITPEVLSLAQDYWKVTEDTLKDLQAAGLPDWELQDWIGYRARQAGGLPKLEKGFAESVVPGQQLRRKEMLKGVPTNMINDWSVDPRLSGPKRTLQPLEVNKEIRQQMRFDDAEFFRLQSNRASLTPEELERLGDMEIVWKQSENLGNWLGTLDQRRAAEGAPLFPNHPLADLMDKVQRDARRLLKAEGLHESIAKLAEQTPDGVPIGQVLEDAGLTLNIGPGGPAARFDPDVIRNPGLRNQTVGGEVAAGSMQGAMVSTLRQLQKRFPGMTLDDMSRLTVPADAAKALTRFTKAATTPAGLEPFIQTWDALTNLWRTFSTSIWPGFHGRNQVQAGFQNWVHGAFNPRIGDNPLGYAEAWRTAKHWYDGSSLSDAAKQIKEFANLTDAEADKALRREIFDWNVTRQRHGSASSDIAGAMIQHAPQKLGMLDDPLGAQQSLSSILGEYLPRSREQAMPWKQVGVLGHSQDVFAPVKSGRKMAQALDEINNVSIYIAKRQQGFAPEAALRESIAAHYDYSNLSSFERKVMRRLVPFYNFLRQNTPAVLGELTRRPGGRLAATIRAGNAGRENEGFVPDYIGQGLALPLGGEAAGTQRFLSQFGLPVEAAGELADFGTNPVQRTAEKLLSQTNPLLKAPLELLTGRQFFSGRELEDLRPITNITPVDQFITNSPLGRFYTTGRTLADERKWQSPGAAAALPLNLLTGVRLTDVDMAKQRELAGREIMEQMLRTSPEVKSYETFYVPAEQVPQLSEEERQLMRLYRTLEKRQREKAKQKR